MRAVLGLSFSDVLLAVSSVEKICFDKYRLVYYTTVQLAPLMIYDTVLYNPTQFSALVNDAIAQYAQRTGIKDPLLVFSLSGARVHSKIISFVEGAVSEALGLLPEFSRFSCDAFPVWYDAANNRSFYYAVYVAPEILYGYQLVLQSLPYQCKALTVKGAALVQASCFMIKGNCSESTMHELVSTSEVATWCIENAPIDDYFEGSLIPTLSAQDKLVALGMFLAGKHNEEY